MYSKQFHNLRLISLFLDMFIEADQTSLGGRVAPVLLPATVDVPETFVWQWRKLSMDDRKVPFAPAMPLSFRRT